MLLCKLRTWTQKAFLRPRVKDTMCLTFIRTLDTQNLHFYLFNMDYIGLYNGFGWLATGRMLGVGARFGTYELLTAFYKDGRKDNYVYVSEALTTGIVAGGVESLMNSLFELFTIRAQVSAVSRVPNSSTNLQKASVSTSVTKLLRGYNPDVKALDHSIGLVCCPP
uniref:Putative carrier protein n=1 Tax=Helianthus annuus TaxID=4232 RepID=A0A251S9P0_HELAN